MKQILTLLFALYCLSAHSQDCRPVRFILAVGESHMAGKDQYETSGCGSQWIDSSYYQITRGATSVNYVLRGRITPAIAPANWEQHHGPTGANSARVSNFYVKYLRTYYGTKEDFVVIPCARGATGFHPGIDSLRNGTWNPGDSLFQDMLSLCRAVQDSFPNGSFHSVISIFGQNDISIAEYVTNPDSFDFRYNRFINALRDSLSLDSCVPIIAGTPCPETMEAIEGIAAIKPFMGKIQVTVMGDITAGISAGDSTTIQHDSIGEIFAHIEEVFYNAAAGKTVIRTVENYPVGMESHTGGMLMYTNTVAVSVFQGIYQADVRAVTIPYLCSTTSGGGQKHWDACQTELIGRLFAQHFYYPCE